MASAPDNLNDRRLNRAVAHVNSLWFPFNPEVLKSLEEAFKAGNINDTPDRILEKIGRAHV